MADALLLRSLNSKSVNLSCKHLEKVPKIVGKLTRVVHIDLKSNRLKELPHEFGYLIQVGFISIKESTVRTLKNALCEFVCEVIVYSLFVPHFLFFKVCVSKVIVKSGNCNFFPFQLTAFSKHVNSSMAYDIEWVAYAEHCGNF